MSDATIELLSVGEVIPQPDWHMPMHSHPIHELIVVLHGKMRLETENENLMVGPGDVLLYRSGMAHRETSDARHPVNTYFIAFKSDEAQLEGLPLRLRDDDARVREMASWLMRDHQPGGRTAAQDSLLRVVLHELHRLHSHPVDPWLTTLRDYMQEHFAQKISLDDLAQHGGMSKFAFVRKFKRLIGCTPMRELQAIRLNQARAMLLTSGLPVKAIAPAVGLTDEYQLSKLFRKRFKLSPTELRTRAG